MQIKQERVEITDARSSTNVVYTEIERERAMMKTLAAPSFFDPFWIIRKGNPEAKCWKQFFSNVDKKTATPFLVKT